MVIRRQLYCLLFCMTNLFISVNSNADEINGIALANIANNSDSEWKVKITLVSGTLAEESYCHNQQECIIPPKATKTIYYKAEPFIGSVEITDEMGISKSYFIEPRNRDFWWDKIWYTNLPEIIHDGNTGAVDLNKPDYGSITIKAGNWFGNL